MKLFRQTLSRERTLWLAGNAAVLCALGTAIWTSSYDYLKHPLGAPKWRIVLAAVGSIAAIATGAVIVAACGLRLLRPFNTNGLGFDLLRVLVPEAVLCIWAGMILDGGETALRVLACVISFNLLIGAMMKRQPNQSLQTDG